MLNIIDTPQVNETTEHGNMYFVLDLPKNDHFALSGKLDNDFRTFWHQIQYKYMLTC